VTSYVVSCWRLRSCRAVGGHVPTHLDLLGGALAVIAYLLWPTWESRLVGPQLADLLEAQARLLRGVLGVFADPTGPTAAASASCGRSPGEPLRHMAELALDG